MCTWLLVNSMENLYSNNENFAPNRMKVILATLLKLPSSRRLSDTERDASSFQANDWCVNLNLFSYTLWPSNSSNTPSYGGRLLFTTLSEGWPFHWRRLSSTALQSLWTHLEILVPVAGLGTSPCMAAILRLSTGLFWSSELPGSASLCQ